MESSLDTGEQPDKAGHLRARENTDKNLTQVEEEQLLYPAKMVGSSPPVLLSQGVLVQEGGGEHSPLRA